MSFALLGHSHAQVLNQYRQANPLGPESRFVDLLDEALRPDWDWDEQRPRAAAATAVQAALSGISTAVLALIGSEFSEAGLLRPVGASDWYSFVPGGVTPDHDAAVGHLVPFAALEAQLAGPEYYHTNFCRWLAAGFPSARIVVVCPPPPLRDSEALLARLEPEYRSRLEANALELAPAHQRMAWFRAAREFRLRSAAAVGAYFVDVPEAVVDADGFLRPEYAMQGNATHGNAHYAELVWQDVAAVLELLRPEGART